MSHGHGGHFKLRGSSWFRFNNPHCLAIDYFFFSSGRYPKRNFQEVTINDSSFYTAARGLGGWSWKRGESHSKCVDALFFRCLGRTPSQVERTVLLDLLDDQRRTLISDVRACRAILGIDATADEDGLADRAAWVLVARAVLNLAEFFTRE